MKVCVFGCKSTTKLLAQRVSLLFGKPTLVTISAERARSAEVADFVDLKPWADSQSFLVRVAERYDLKTDGDLDFFRNAAFDVGFVIGWQRLIPEAILTTFRTGVFGMHGSAGDLPLGRGRSPMNWALLEGRRVFYTNLFRYDPGVDSGDILDTMAFSISEHDTAETLHFKNTLAMAALIERNSSAFQAGELPLRPQSNLEPTYYPKRSPEDSLIDWTAPIDVIERFVRAVAPPFNGAFTFAGRQKVVIRRAAIFEFDSVSFGFSGRQSGEVVEVFPNGKLLVKCLGGLLLVHEYDAAPGSVIERGEVFNCGDQGFKDFPQNRHGGHDLPA